MWGWILLSSLFSSNVVRIVVSVINIRVVYILYVTKYKFFKRIILSKQKNIVGKNEMNNNFDVENGMWIFMFHFHQEFVFCFYLVLFIDIVFEEYSKFNFQIFFSLNFFFFRIYYSRIKKYAFLRFSQFLHTILFQLYNKIVFI